MVNTHLLLIMTGVSWHVLCCCLMMLQTPVVHSTPLRSSCPAHVEGEHMSLLQLLPYKAQQHSWDPPLMVLHTKTLVVVSKHNFLLPLRLPVRTAGNTHVFGSCSKILWSSCVKALREETANGRSGVQFSLISVGFRCLIHFYTFIVALF